MRYRPTASFSALASLLFLASPSAPLAAQTRATEGYVDAGNGVRLFYRLVGTGRDTLVIIHGGPGLSFNYFGHELDPLASRGACAPLLRSARRRPLHAGARLGRTSGAAVRR
jgi:hypothetical protein